MTRLVMIRHGQSTWNLQNRFTGWVDVTLSPKGIEEAIAAGRKIADTVFDVAYTSTLVRAQHTLALACAQTTTPKDPIFVHSSGRMAEWSHYTGEDRVLPVIISEALNERYYGDLQGLNKADTAAKYGDEQVHLWRRSFDVPPPNGESLKDTIARTWPYFESVILPELRAGKNVLIVAHGNSLRSIVKKIENISDADIPGHEIATGDPLVYDFDDEAFTRA